MKNEDSLFKFLAYSGMLEKKRREERQRTGDINVEAAYGLHTFDEFYKSELERQAFTNKPREYKSDSKDY